jgi:hypothetical protein
MTFEQNMVFEIPLYETAQMFQSFRTFVYAATEKFVPIFLARRCALHAQGLDVLDYQV